MKYSLSWLSEYVTLKKPLEALTDQLIMTTAEVEEVIEPPLPLKTGLVGEVISVVKHPNADRLRLVTVRTSRGQDTVVCGAPNVAVGQKVPFLPAGSYYQGDGGSFCTLAAASIRGVKSAGMLASEHDLGLSNDHSGILILPPETVLTTSLAAALNFEKPVLNLEITPNRGDLLSYWGLAREIAFIEKTRLKDYSLLSLNESGDHASEPIIELESEGCRRYTALVIDEITNGPSPVWLQQRLRLSGIEPINAIVDIANYVMLEIGQPLHTFDWHAVARKTKQPRITIRQARKGETINCLDHVERTLTSEDLVIATPDGPAALAGVIGDTTTAVQAGTTRIILESASFEPSAVRRMAKRHNLRTEAVSRFEKGVDVELPVRALKRAAFLLKEVCGGKPVGKVVDSGKKPSRHAQVSVDIERASRLLGLPVTKATVRLLSQIGFEITDKKSTIVEVTVPSWREDIVAEEDIFEEIVRLVGYDQLPATIPCGPITPPPHNTTFTLHRAARLHLAACGAREVVSQAFLSDTDAKILDYKDAELLRLSNPPTRHETYARPSLLPALIARLAREALAGQNDIRSFEIGHTFRKDGQHHVETDNLAIAVMTTNPENAAREIKSWISSLPQAVERGLTVAYEKGRSNNLLSKAESIVIDNEPAGFIGALKASTAQKYKIRGKRVIVLAEIDLEAFLAAVPQVETYQDLSPYPAVNRDLSISFDTSKDYGQIFKQVSVATPEDCTLKIVDTYVDDKQKRLTIRLTFQASDRTLTDQEVEEKIKKFAETIVKLGLQIQS